jgi:1,4-alpha-glucan branching enzyme
MRRLSLPIAAAITLAASLGGYALHGLMAPDVSTQHASPALAVAPATSARQGGVAVTYEAAVAESAPVQVQLVFDAPDARSVALVGDFNDWDAARAPMRSEGGGVWSTTLTLRPGRYVYAFVVNDREWRTDPRTPRVKDPDLGTESSVMIVGAR